LTVDLDVQIVHSVEEVGQEAWDRLGGGRPFASYRWYRFGETVLVGDTPIYVILSSRGEPVARATFWLTRREPIEIPSAVLSEALSRLAEMVLRRWPLLVCRSPLCSTTGLVLPDDPQLRDSALEVIARLARDLMQQHRSSFLVMDYLGSGETARPVWSDGFITAKLPEPGTCLHIAWPDFESYLGQLSRKRRKHYRQHQKRAAEMGVEITRHRTVTDVDGAMALIWNVAKRYRTRPFHWTRRVLENAGMVDAVWLAARVDDRLVGCELVLGDGGTWFVTALGRDYEFDYVYFLLGYEDIRYAIERGATTLRWGSCTYDVKRRLGFRLEGNNYVAFTGRGPLLYGFSRWVAAMLTS